MKIISRKEAVEKGLPSFFTGKPCKRGHVAKRGVIAGNCYKCDYERTLAKRIAMKSAIAIARGKS